MPNALDICRDPEGWVPISSVRKFDLTFCFEEGALLAPILVLLAVIGAARIYSLSSLESRQRTRKSTWVLGIKVTLLACAILLSLANLIFITFSYNAYVAIPQLYILEPISLLLTPFLTYFNHTRTRTSSTILLLFWPTYLAALSIWTRSVLSGHNAKLAIPLILRIVTAVSGFIAFILECAGPEVGLTEDECKGVRESPLETANIFSIWTFEWMSPLLKKGASLFITEDDLPPLLAKDEAALLGLRLEEAMQKYKSLWVALFAAYGGPYAFAAFLKLLQDSLAFLQPQLLRWLLSYVSTYQSARENEKYGGPEPPSSLQGFMIAGIMFVAAITQTVILHQYFQRCFETGMRVRAGLVSTIYQKALRLSNDESGRSSGDIINFMSVDATRLQDFCTYGLIAISGPFQITLAFVSLYQLLGWPAFVGVAIMVFSIPLNAAIARVLKRMQEAQMKNRDKRTRMMSELLNNIKSIKLYAWENAFIRRILEVRNQQELKMLRRIGIASSLNVSLWTGIPLLVAFSSFAVAAVTSATPLTSDIIFPAISLFMLLQFPLAMFAQVTSNVIEAVVSINRLSSFLNADELQTDARTIESAEKLQKGDVVVTIKNGTFNWRNKSVSPTLEDIDLIVRKGELTGVMGKVGAGKSSLLSAIIGDMRREEGEVILKGSIAYAPQNPWIMSATVKDNILFAHEYDEEFYNLVLDACALRPDLTLLPQGDMTEVGEKGITLSGGQKARISLARAVYARSDLILLDDVLAAVDSHVARHIFDQVIGPYGLLASKARILVTNSIAFLSQYDQIIFLRRGIILESGSYTELMSVNDSYISKLIKGHGVGLSSSGSSTPRVPSEWNGSSDDTVVSTPLEEFAKGDSEKPHSPVKQEYNFNTEKALVVGLPLNKISDNLSKEHSEQGRVKADVYVQYIRAASIFGFVLFILAAIAQQGTSVLSNIVLRSWGEHNREEGNNRGMGKYLLAYGVSSLASVIFGAMSATLMWVFISLRSARHLHDSMLYSVLRAPLSFFELTPTGRVLNLFSRDTYVVDQILARVIGNMFRTLCTCAGIIVVIGASFPLFLVAVIPLALFYRRVMIYYLTTSRELKRLDAVSRSPIFAWFSESLGGLSTIRAFSLQKVFIKQNEFRVDRNQVCYLPSISVNRWLAVRLELVGALIILTASVLAIIALITTGVDAGLVGLVLSYGLNTTSSLNWVVRSASEVEQNIVSVERILHYIRLDPEAPAELPEQKPSQEWPNEGNLEFKEYSMRYRPELDLCLKDISLRIKGREKIGICGRTGAGKSSLLLALFRIIEPASGTILIDGIDITTLGLHDLRSVISIVPQSPDLFEGTIRENIDPLGEHQDADIWVALEQAHLRSYVESLPELLDAPVREGGTSMSQGQRQLLCFARALLRKTKILVLDEATSAVDLETDKAIQEIIRGPQFASMTMLIIAHRLNTILDSDRVLVLSDGKVKEFDEPEKLLQDRNSVFFSLAAEAGLA